MKLTNNGALEEAASSGHLDVVQWLITNCEDLDIVPAMEDPIVNGHFEVLLYLHSALVGVYSAYDLNEIWKSLREGIYPQSNEEIVAWFAENYPCPAEEDVEREMTNDMDGMDDMDSELLDDYFEAAMERLLLRFPSHALAL